jgi:hypothetical protein
MTTSGSCPPSVLAHSQMPMPLVQWRTRFHVQVLQVLLLVGDDDVDVVAAAQAVIGDRQKAIGIGRQVDARDRRALVDHQIQEARILVGEAVVILAPHRRGDEQVERRQVGPPGQVAADLQPLGVLVEHGIDDVREGFVGREEAVPPGEQIAFQPAFQRVLGQHLHHAAVGAKLGPVAVVGQGSAIQHFLVTA